MAYLVLGVVIISKDDNGGRWQEKKKKNMYLKRSPRVALLLQVTFTFMHSIGLMWMQKFCKFAHLKPIFFYFIHSFLQNTYISLSILHIYLIKFSFFYNFFNYFLTHCLSLSLSLSHCLSLSLRPNHHHHPPRSVNRPIQDPLKLLRLKSLSPRHFRAMEMWVSMTPATLVTRAMRLESVRSVTRTVRVGARRRREKEKEAETRERKN